ncbi:hypothetical protein RHMOL_Rhmol01G0234700 [Rhododendron molle]|uniref:Uncharacterized protein n=1 Tax=Rhododendron molle TaxID=49168 RepID=A0ACC0Q7B5_RHOML|nr:hypothetical protein RHMOL_Rhmol01G0234700 [Rhododendron molle]
MANVGIHGIRDGSLTAAKQSSNASFCWRFKTLGAVVDQTTHNPDLLTSTTRRDLVKPIRIETKPTAENWKHQAPRPSLGTYQPTLKPSPASIIRPPPLPTRSEEAFDW